jgi:hypothetical protein
MKYPSPILLSLILVLNPVLHTAIPAQTRKQRARQAKPSSTSPLAIQYDFRPFDNSLTHLPPNYQGHSFVSVFNTLEKREPQLKKGEFETTVAYRQRIADANQIPLFGTVKPTDLLAFSLSPDSEQLTSTYDADKQKLHIILEAYENENRDDPRESAVYLWASKTDKLRSYTARTNFRQPISINVFRNADSYLTFDESQLTNWQPGELPNQLQRGRYERDDKKRRLETFVSIPLNRAPYAKANLRALIVCEIGEASVFKSEDREEPTVDDPNDVYNQIFSFNIILQEIWFYNGASGEVFYKLKSSSIDSLAENNIADNTVYPPSQVNVKAKIRNLYEAENALKGQGLRGEITLRVVLLGNGKVGDVQVIKTSTTSLVIPAINAAKKIVFDPARLNNKPVGQRIDVIFTVEPY